MFLLLALVCSRGVVGGWGCVGVWVCRWVDDRFACCCLLFFVVVVIVVVSLLLPLLVLVFSLGVVCVLLLGVRRRLSSPAARAQLGRFRSRPVMATDGREAGGDGERLLLMEFSRCPRGLRHALCYEATLQQCRQALVKAKRYWELPSGAKVFVHPHQYDDTVAILDKLGLVLLKRHVVVVDSLEHMVNVSVSDLRLNVNIRHIGAVRASDASSSRSKPARAKKKDNPQERVAAVKLREGDSPYPARARPLAPDPTDSTEREWAQPWPKDLSLNRWRAVIQPFRKRHAADLDGCSEDGLARDELNDAADEVRAAAGSAASSSAQTEMCLVCGENPPGGWCSMRACVVCCLAETGGPRCEQHWGGR